MPTRTALLGKFFNYQANDILQVINEGGEVVFGIDATGVIYPEIAINAVKQLVFLDGSIQDTAYVIPQLPQTGVAVCTGSSSTVTFSKPYVGSASPAVVATQIDSTPNGLSICISMIGSPGNWTGFTLKLSSSFFGAYSWIAYGNPN